MILHGDLKEAFLLMLGREWCVHYLYCFGGNNQYYELRKKMKKMEGKTWKGESKISSIYR